MSQLSELLLLADVHGNAVALETVLEDVGVPDGGVVVAGDVVGYGPQPEKCVNILRDLDATVVMGNHDAALVGELSREWFNHHARDALAWQEDQLSAASVSWLKNLSRTIETDGLQVVHGSPDQPLEKYVMNLQDFKQAIESSRRDGLVVGHTHVPALVVERGGELVPYAGEDLPTDGLDLSESRFVINPGSVGQPRDRDPRASCALIDPAGSEVRFDRIPYDVGGVQQQILEAGYSNYLADRLDEGR